MTPSNEQLADFLDELRQDLINRASVEGGEAFLQTALTQRVIEDLIDIGDLQDGQACHLKRNSYAISGYELDEDDGRLDLFVTLFTGSPKPGRVPRKEVDAAIEGALKFRADAAGGVHKKLEEASPAYDMAERIHVTKDIGRIRVYVFTDGIVKAVERPTTQRDGAVVSYHVWDLVGLLRLARSGAHPEPINLKIKELGRFEVPCIEAPASTGDYRAYLAIFPGPLLAAIYSTFGPRLLELNVRSYLQARGKVNAGIRNTIKKEPEHFLAYNNGISVTAARVDLEPGKAGTLVLTAIDDMQIVNGGQTTASIFNASKKDKADLSKLYVAAKITVVPPNLIDEFVPKISRYANSQNKVNEADFAANDTFHVSVEQLSRSVWAPAPEGTQKMTKWFYERARGSYADALAQEETTARRDKFKADFPTSQKFTKTDLAKFENSWDQLPHVVSMGAEKNFQEFAIAIGRQRRAIDEAEYRNIIARAILFKATETIVTRLRLVGYRANVVAYSIAYLAHQTESKLDLDRIWQSQGVTPRTIKALEAIAPRVYEGLTEHPGVGNVTEWAKKAACWDEIRVLSIRLPDLTPELLAVGRSGSGGGGAGAQALSAEDEDLIAKTASVPAESWFTIATWARETNHLKPWERSLCVSLGRIAKSSRRPSVKQAAHGSRILDETRRLGLKV